MTIIYAGRDGDEPGVVFRGLKGTVGMGTHIVCVASGLLDVV